MRRLFLLFVSLFAAVTSGRAQTPAPAAAVPQITGQTFEADFDTGDAVYRGDVRAQWQDITLRADEMRYNVRQRTIAARGHVVLTQDRHRLLAAELVYDLAARRYRVQDLRFGSGPIYVSGSLVEGEPDRLEFHDARVSYGEPGRWAPTIVADALSIYPERERMRAQGASLGLGLAAPIPLPATELPTNLDFLTYLSFNAGYTRSLGAFLELGVHLPVAPGVSLGGDVGYFTARGWLLGPSGSYSRGRGTDREVQGEFQTGFIHDSGEKLLDLLQEPVPEDRGFVLWTHRQRLGAQLTIAGQLNYWSDSEVVRDFRPREFFPVQTPDNFAEVTHLTDNAVLGFFARAQLNDYHTIRERLPELTFSLLPTHLGGGWYHELQSSAVRLEDDPPTGGPTLRSDRLDAYYAITRPFTPREWLTFSPVAGARLTHYARALGGRDDYTRALGEFGFDAELRASGTFDYRNERWGINGLRHLVTPRVSYRSIPDATKGSTYIPSIDRRVFGTYLEPLGLGSRRQIDDLAATNTFRLALDNRLQTRGRDGEVRDLIAYQVAADVRFDREPNQHRLSALHQELRLMPARWLAVDIYHRQDLHGGGTEEFNAAVTLLNADRWAVRVANHYLRDDIQEHLAGVSYQLNEVFGVYAQLHYDARRRRFNEQRYGLTHTLENRWVVGYELSFFEGPRRESDFGFNLRLQTVSF